MVRSFFRKLVNLTTNTNIFPVTKLVFILLVLAWIPLLASGVQLLTSGDTGGRLVHCEDFPSYVNVTCQTWRIFMTSVTNPTNGEVTEAMSLDNALPGHYVPNTLEVLPFYADLSPRALMITPTFPTEVLQTVGVTTTLDAATVNNRRALTTSLYATPHPRASKCNSVTQTSSVPVHTYAPVTASPLETDFFSVEGSWMITLFVYTLVILALLWYYIKNLAQDRLAPEPRREDIFDEMEEWDDDDPVVEEVRNAGIYEMLNDGRNDLWNDAAPGMARNADFYGMWNDTRNGMWNHGGNGMRNAAVSVSTRSQHEP